MNSAPHPGQMLNFSVAGAKLALPAGAVREIIRPRALTRVPHAPAHVLGVANLRGTVLPVLSTAILLGRQAPAATAATRILVLDGAPDMALLVDNVASIGESAGQEMLDLNALLTAAASPLVRTTQHAERAAALRIDGPLRRPDSSVPETTHLRSLICVQAAGQDFALPLEDVIEVTNLPDCIVPLPGSEIAMLGSSDYRGGLLAVLSLNDLLGLPRPPKPAHGHMLVVRVGTQCVGLAVEATKDVLRVHARDIEAVPPILTRGRGETRIEAICRQDNGGRLVSILSTELLFDAATQAAMAAIRIPDAIATTLEKATNAGAGEIRRFVAFRLGNEDYALPVDIVDEVVRHPRKLARVPRAPEWLRGVMNLRGAVVPVIDPSVRYASLAGVDVAPPRNKTTGRVVVVTVEGIQAGLAVDEVRNILSLSIAALHAAPQLTEAADRMVDRIAVGAEDDQMICVLDPKAVLDRAERDLLAEFATRPGIQAPA